MDPLIIEKTRTKPNIIFDKANGIFEIKGKSLPENAEEFYNPIIEWLKAYLENPNPSTMLVFEMEYVNSSSSKKIYEIIEMLETPAKNGIDVKVNWRYLEEDDDTLEVGNEYASLVKVPFVFSTF
jgi:hypothetical protein